MQWRHQCVRKKAGVAVLTVADQGPGVPEKKRDRIFEPFYRSEALEEQSSNGERHVGLGLSLVRKIARRHGGEVQCLPRAGGGTSFEVELRDST
ncbi:MAG: sensor histidine kinase [Congregibacter sp.]